MAGKNEEAIILRTRGTDKVRRDLDAVAAGQKRIAVETVASAGAARQQAAAVEATSNAARSAQAVLGGMVSKFTAAIVTATAATYAFKNALDFVKAGASDLAIDEAFFKKFKTGKDLIAQAREELKGTVEDTDIQKIFIIGSNLGLTAENLLSLSRAAANLAGKTGEDTKTLFEEMVRSIAAQRTQTIKARGVQMDMNRATQEYADKIGVAKQKLTEFQKQQAIIEGLQAQNAELFQRAGATIQQSIQKTGTAWGNFMSDVKVATVKQLSEAVIAWREAFRDIGSSLELTEVRLGTYLERISDLHIKLGLVSQGEVESNATREAAAQVTATLGKELRGLTEGTSGYIAKLGDLALKARTNVELARQQYNSALINKEGVAAAAKAYYFWSMMVGKTNDALTKNVELMDKAEKNRQKRLKKPKKKGGGKKGPGSIRGEEIESDEGGLFGFFGDPSLFSQGGPNVPKDVLGTSKKTPALDLQDQLRAFEPAKTLEGDTSGGLGKIGDFALDYDKAMTKIADASLVAKDGIFGLTMALGGVFSAMQQGTGPALAATSKFLSGLVKNRSAYAAWEAGMQYYLGFATMYTNPPESIAHFIAAAGLTAQAVRPLFGGGGGGSAGKSMAPAMDRSLVPRPDRRDAQTPATLIVNFNGPVGDKVAAAREFAGVLNDGHALDPSIRVSSSMVRGGLVGGL